MASNPYVNKVEYGGNVLIDITDTTATSSDVLSGKDFYTASGAKASGSIVSRADSGTTRLNASTTSKSFAAGYYANAHGCDVAVYDGSVS